MVQAEPHVEGAKNLLDFSEWCPALRRIALPETEMHFRVSESWGRRARALITARSLAYQSKGRQPRLTRWIYSGIAQTTSASSLPSLTSRLVSCWCWYAY